MKEKDLRKELAGRKFKITNRLYYFIYRTVMMIIAKRKYKPHFEIIDDVNDCDGPAFVIFNHLSRLDHLYVMEACYPRRMNMVAGYCEFFRKHLHWAFKQNNVIPKKQYTNDLISTKGIMSIINKGGLVAFAPEGLATNDGMPKPIVPHTGHLFKKMGIPVYFVELRGQYLLNTKVCLDVRTGDTYATMKLLFSKEDLEKYSVEELDDKINEAFWHDEYAWAKEHRIAHKTYDRMGYHLEDLLFQCPKCGVKHQMKGEGNSITCLACGNSATINEYYDLIPNEGSTVPELISTWVNNERIQIIKEIRKDDNYTYEMKADIGMIPNDHYVDKTATSEKVASGKIIVDHEGMHFRGKNDAKFDFDVDYKALYTLFTEVDSSSASFYLKGEYVEIFPKEKSALELTWLVEEMHRLHVNFYKNFKWNAYMYEEE